jgi:glucose/arabinose dehydrogenase
LRRPGQFAFKVLNDPDVNKNGSVKECTTAKFNRPIQAMGPHTAGLGLRFYNWREGANFPKEWHRKLFVAQRGSWNRQLKIGYRVMVLTLNWATTRAVKFEEFATGWLQDAGTKEASVKGRPVDLSQLPDGSLLVSGDYEGIIYRIYYKQ